MRVARDARWNVLQIYGINFTYPFDRDLIGNKKKKKATLSKKTKKQKQDSKCICHIQDNKKVMWMTQRVLLVICKISDETKAKES